MVSLLKKLALLCAFLPTIAFAQLLPPGYLSRGMQRGKTVY
jgi:hypothetical protein